VLSREVICILNAGHVDLMTTWIFTPYSLSKVMVSIGKVKGREWRIVSQVTCSLPVGACYLHVAMWNDLIKQDIGDL